MTAALLSSGASKVKLWDSVDLPEEDTTTGVLTELPAVTTHTMAESDVQTDASQAVAPTLLRKLYEVVPKPIPNTDTWDDPV